VDAEDEAGGADPVSPLIDRLSRLRREINHLREIRPRVTDPESLSQDFSLRNDVLHSLQVVCQAVVDIASELSARRYLRYQDYTQAVQNMAAIPEVPQAVALVLAKLPGFRNVLVHEYLALDYSRVIEALDNLDPVEEFARIVARIETEAEG
jgi:uncharacterized protein YutE (UPF0331/DUF86 family)